MTEPVRIQRKRTKGWKMPPNTVSVTRPGKWGNPWTFQNSGIIDPVMRFACETLPLLDLSELRGKNIACWCPIGADCHGDVLLEAANESEAPELHRWPAKGDRMKFLGRGGYPFQLADALKVFAPGQIYIVADCEVSSFTHSVKFEGIEGCYNGVMFELLGKALARSLQDQP